MFQSTLPNIEKDSPVRTNMRLLLLGVFLLSSSLLALEVTLSRLLSVMLSYHYVYMVVSLALLGLGTGAIFVSFFKPQLTHIHDGGFSNLARFASLFSLSVLLSILMMTMSTVVNIFLFSFFLFLPFLFAGMFLAEVFRTFPALSSRIYGADLIGAGVGSIGVIFSLNTIGGPNTVFSLGITLALVSLLFAVRTTGRRLKVMALPTLSLLAALILLWVNLANPYLTAKMVEADPTKEIYSALGTEQNGEIIETRWSAFGRTDLVRFRDYPALMSLYIDGTAGTPMYQFNGDFNNPDPAIDRLKTGFPGYLPLSFLQEEERENALIIGTGGGRDILLALMGNVAQITAVEVNNDLVDIVKDYARYNGGIYTDFDNVSIVIDEGRSFLRRQSEKYDIIMLSLPVTRTSRSPEGYALTENFLFTTNSINDYLEHLTDEGRLIVVLHDSLELLRLLSVSLAALEQSGIDNQAAMERIYIINSDDFPVFVMKKTAFRPEETGPVYQLMQQLGYDFSISYLPVIDESSTLNPLFMAVASGDSNFSQIEMTFKESYQLDVSPVTDNNPFFYKFEKGTPTNVSLILWVSIIMLLLVILAPLLYLKSKSHYRKAKPKKRNETGLKQNLFRYVVLFSMLGIGFMLVEISTIQRFILFLGHPVLSLAVLLFSLLVGAGMGSLYSGRFAPEKIIRVIAIVSMFIVAVLLIYTFSLSVIFRQLMGLELAIRILVTVAMLTPLGLLMGFPFPLGLRLLKETGMEGYIPWMWGINGIGSVLGSTLTIVVAISFGLAQAMLLGAACYFVVFLTFQRSAVK